MKTCTGGGGGVGEGGCGGEAEESEVATTIENTSNEARKGLSLTDEIDSHCGCGLVAIQERVMVVVVVLLD